MPSPQVVALSVRDAPHRMKNIHYAGQGYDIVRGNPQCSSGCIDPLDPGFYRTSNVIELSYTTGKTTPDGRYLVPDSLDIESAVSCSLVSSTSAIHSAFDYQQSLNVDASVDTSFHAWLAQVHFSASVDYQHMSHNTGASASTYYSTRAACSPHAPRRAE